jgi:hypothetical protein
MFDFAALSLLPATAPQYQQGSRKQRQSTHGRSWIDFRCGHSNSGRTLGNHQPGQ